MFRTQTGVLVRTDDDGLKLMPLANGSDRDKLADRLATIFKVPVRKINLTKSESRALNDC